MNAARFSLLVLFLSAAVVQIASAADLPAFPGAEGYGALVTGGRGGEIVHVSTLKDAGPGSLREAVSRPNRYVVFDVAGIIKLESNLSVSDNITLAGQTAFAGGGDGICIYNRSVSFSDKKNIIVRYLRFREGIAGDRGKCSVNIATGANMIFDHCSIQWGRWDSLGCTVNSHDITFQHCIIGEAIDPQRFGALVDSVEHVTIAHNLWINNNSRNPKAKGTIQYINNVVYNYGGTGLVGGHSAADHLLDVTNNYLIAGPSSTGHALGQFSKTDQVNQTGNLIDTDRDGKLNGRPAAEADYGSGDGAPTFMPASWGKPKIPVSTVSAEEAVKQVLAEAGCSLRRDPVDERLIAALASYGKLGKVIQDEAEVGGMPALKGGTAVKDTDHDGMPDEWETAHGLDPNDAADAAKIDAASGYMNIEVYANGIVKGK